MSEWLALILGPLIGSALLTGTLRRSALSGGLLDIPNARSSHTVPTPRGGGAAIALVVLLAMPMLAWRGGLPPSFLWAQVGAGLLVGTIGWLDDNHDVAARWRLLAHFTAASWALACIGGFPRLPFLGVMIDLGWFGDALGVLYLVWLLNLYNFMDGIDGIAGIEAVTVCAGAALLYELSAIGYDAIVPPLVLAGAVGGFLIWNFPRARIFMGDVGSGFIGVSLGLLSLEAGWVAPELFWGWLILLGAFVVDATSTLIRRLLRGERLYEAHRSHAYQRAARQLGSHIPVSLTFGAVNILWLLPIAGLVALRKLDGVVGVLFAYLPLLCLALLFGAGKIDEPKSSSATNIASP